MILEIEIQRVIKIGQSQFSLEDGNLHGFSHWYRVEKNGLLLARDQDVDTTVVRLFAHLHDCKRQDDAQDPEHGDRAAIFVRELRESNQLDFLSEKQYMQLHTACLLHHKGVVDRVDLTIGACFDSDRLDLVRCGITPNAFFMSTPEAIKMVQI